MRIRHYTPADLDALRRLHAAQGFGYPFPDLDSPLFITKLVLEENSESDAGSGYNERREPQSRELDGKSAGSREVANRNSPPETSSHCAEDPGEDAYSCSNPPRIAMAVLLRLTAEAYLLHDGCAGTPRQRWQNLLALHEAARQDAAARGLDDVQAFLPPQIARAFGRRLARLGWCRDPWPCFSKAVES